MIALRTYGVDSQSTAQLFVPIPVPVGTRDGDLVLVGISLKAAGVVITPPSDEWQLVNRTDPALTSNVAVYWKFALNEPAHWVFEQDQSLLTSAVAAVYGGCDGFEPIEASAGATTSTSSVTQNAPGVTVSDDNEVVALFMGLLPAASATYADASGFHTVTSKFHAGVEITLLQRDVGSATAIAPFTLTASLTGQGSGVAVVLRRSPGTRSVDDVRERIVAALPRGASRIYDLSPGGDYYKYFQAWALTLKVFCYDLVDLLRLEVIPHHSRYKLPDWESIFGISRSLTALTGTLPARRAQVKAFWRAAAGQGSAAPAVRAVMGAALGYFPDTVVQIVTTDRAALTALHTYTNSSGFSVPVTLTDSQTVSIPEGGRISRGGAQLFLNISGTANQFVATLTGPDGTSRTWSVLGTHTGVVQLWAKEFVRKPLNGTWTLTLTNSNVATLTLNSWSVFTEAIDPGYETGGAIFDWGVYADPAHLGENGTNADFNAARLALRRLRFSHTVQNLLQSLDPYPDVDSGAHAAIPDEATPV